VVLKPKAKPDTHRHLRQRGKDGLMPRCLAGSKKKADATHLLVLVAVVVAVVAFVCTIAEADILVTVSLPRKIDNSHDNDKTHLEAE
jgi:hypothetical protein